MNPVFYKDGEMSREIIADDADTVFIDTKRKCVAPIIGVRTLWFELSQKKPLCDEIAYQLEIQADGGDDAGSYVQAVAVELVEKNRLQSINKKIQELEASK